MESLDTLGTETLGGTASQAGVEPVPWLVHIVYFSFIHKYWSSTKGEKMAYS